MGKMARPLGQTSNIIRQTKFRAAKTNLSVSTISAEFIHEGRCLLLLLRIRSAHLEILGFPMGGGY